VLRAHWDPTYSDVGLVADTTCSTAAGWKEFVSLCVSRRASSLQTGRRGTSSPSTLNASSMVSNVEGGMTNASSSATPRAAHMRVPLTWLMSIST
jgi:hypothetical protein